MQILFVTSAHNSLSQRLFVELTRRARGRSRVCASRHCAQSALPEHGQSVRSGYWTYTLPRRVGAERALELTTACQPIGTEETCDNFFGPDISYHEARRRFVYKLATTGSSSAIVSAYARPGSGLHDQSW